MTCTPPWRWMRSRWPLRALYSCLAALCRAPINYICYFYLFPVSRRRRRRRCGSRSLFVTIFPECNSHFLLRNRFRPDNKSSRAKRQRMLISAVKKLSVRARRKHLISAKAAGTLALQAAGKVIPEERARRDLFWRQVHGSPRTVRECAWGRPPRRRCVQAAAAAVVVASSWDANWNSRRACSGLEPAGAQFAQSFEASAAPTHAHHP